MLVTHYVEVTIACHCQVGNVVLAKSELRPGRCCMMFANETLGAVNHFSIVVVVVVLFCCPRVIVVTDYCLVAQQLPSWRFLLPELPPFNGFF